MKSFFFSSVKYVYAVVYAAVLGILIFLWNTTYPCGKTFLFTNSVFFCLIVTLLVAGACIYVWTRNKRTAISKVYEVICVDKIVQIGTIVLFLGQCYVFYNAFFLSGWDTWQMRTFVDILLNGENVEVQQYHSWIQQYYSWYPNNLFLSYIYCFLININNSFGIFRSEYQYMCVVILNCVINSLSCLLCYKTAKLFTSPLFSLLAYALCVFSIGISGWSIICYSDSFALFIPILSAYLYCRPYKNKNTKTLGISFSAIVSAIGYFIKPQCLFLFLAIVILEGFKLLSKFSVKALFRPVAVCLAGVTVLVTVNLGIDFLNEKNNIQLDEEKTLGFSHFLMMGANPDSNGVYDEGDVFFSDSFSTQKERTEANIEVFKQRMTDMKSDLLNHLKKKVLITFNDGTFAWGVEGQFFYSIPENINNRMAPFLKSIYCNGDRFIYFGTFLQGVWLFVLTASFLSVFAKRKETKNHNLTLFWIVLLGFFLYEMLFEVRARYIYIFVPMICALAPVGIKNIGVFAENVVAFIKNKKKKVVKT